MSKVTMGLRVLYTTVCIFLIGLGFVANSQMASPLSSDLFSLLMNVSMTVFVLLSIWYLYKHLHNHGRGSFIKAVGSTSLLVLLVGWTDVLAVFTTSNL